MRGLRDMNLSKLVFPLPKLPSPSRFSPGISLLSWYVGIGSGWAVSINGYRDNGYVKLPHASRRQKAHLSFVCLVRPTWAGNASSYQLWTIKQASSVGSSPQISVQPSPVTHNVTWTLNIKIPVSWIHREPWELLLSQNMSKPILAICDSSQNINTISIFQKCTKSSLGRRS